jgi:hexosaminidase
MDPTKEKTYEFLDEFFAEMTKLFPDEYFHIGGDEVEGSQWMAPTSVWSKRNHPFRREL